MTVNKIITTDTPMTSKAIIKYNNQFLLYLRDKKTTIPFPGLWDFFGGGIEPGETITECIKRELLEEIDLELDVEYIETIAEELIPIRYVAIFNVNLTDVDMKKMRFMGEGQRWGLFTVDELANMGVVPHFKRYLK